MAKRAMCELARAFAKAGLVSVILLATACVRVPSISPGDADAVQVAAQKLLEDTAAAPMTSGAPSQIGGLKVKSVRVMPEGVYMQTSSWFVEEAGFFVPRDPVAFAPVPGSDPEYKRTHGNVFSYRIRG